jgi:hypothetical protein
MNIDYFLAEDSRLWVEDLPEFQLNPINELLSKDLSFEAVAQAWLTASATNTYRFSSTAPIGDKGSFLKNVKKELRAFICGDEKYKTERDGLFGEKSNTRTLIVSGMAVAIAPHVSVASAVIAPVIALLLAGLGKITINAWCATHEVE